MARPDTRSTWHGPFLARSIWHGYGTDMRADVFLPLDSLGMNQDHWINKEQHIYKGHALSQTSDYPNHGVELTGARSGTG